MRRCLFGLFAAVLFIFWFAGCGGETPPPKADDTMRIKERCGTIQSKIVKLKELPAKAAQQVEIDSIIKLYDEVKMETAKPGALMGEIPEATIKKMDAKLDEIERRMQALGK